MFIQRIIPFGNPRSNGIIYSNSNNSGIWHFGATGRWRNGIILQTWRYPSIAVNKIGYLFDHPIESKLLGEKAYKAVSILFHEDAMLQKYKDLFQTVAFEEVIARPLAF